MSRVARSPITVPSGVDVNISGQQVRIKGAQGKLELAVHDRVKVEFEDGNIQVTQSNQDDQDFAMAGTMRALLNNMVAGVTEGFERKLILVGVGYRAQAQGKKLNLTLGFSHPVEYAIPEGVTVETPSQTEVVVKGADKQKVGQVAAEIRAYRPPEPYKGKGVKYADERIIRKEAKKK